MDQLANVLQTLPGFLQIVNVVILFSALFFFTSTIASHLVEVFVGWRNSRGQHLRERLEIALGKDAANAIYSDPIINSLASGGAITATPANNPRPPSYIEPEIFARVVARLSQPGGSLNTNPVIQEVLTAAANVPAQIEPKIIEWFKAINDRQTGVYTRYTFFRLIGFLFAVVMDIDTVHIAGTLWNNPEQAEKAVKQLEEASKLSTAGPLAQLSDADKKKLQDSIANAVTQMRTIVPPVYAWQTPPGKLNAKDWIGKFPGWLLTALATSLGAQFWFNIMSEALKLRASGRKPEEDTKKKKGDGGGGGGTDRTAKGKTA